MSRTMRETSLSSKAIAIVVEEALRSPSTHVHGVACRLLGAPNYTIISGLGVLRGTTRSRRLFALLSATYSRHRALNLFGNVFASHGITMTPSHSRPFAL